VVSKSATMNGPRRACNADAKATEAWVRAPVPRLLVARGRETPGASVAVTPGVRGRRL